jgi:hypothetical protein
MNLLLAMYTFQQKATALTRVGTRESKAILILKQDSNTEEHYTIL